MQAHIALTVHALEGLLLSLGLDRCWSKSNLPMYLYGAWLMLA